MNTRRTLTLGLLVVPAALSVLFFVADCQGDWFDNPEFATCNLQDIPLNSEWVMFLYFMGPLTLIATAFLWGGISTALHICRRFSGRRCRR